VALDPSVLISALTTALDPAGPVDAIITATDPPTRIAQAYGHYIAGAPDSFAQALTPILEPPVASECVPAMAGASYPLASPAVGAANLAGAYGDFWSAMTPPATFFAAATAILPPTFAGLALAFAAQFGINQNPAITTAQAATNLGTVIHANTLLTPSVTTPGAPLVVTLIF